MPACHRSSIELRFALGISRCRSRVHTLVLYRVEGTREVERTTPMTSPSGKGRLIANLTLTAVGGYAERPAPLN